MTLRYNLIILTYPTRWNVAQIHTGQSDFFATSEANNFCSSILFMSALNPGHGSHLLSSKDTDWSNHVLTLKWEV